MRLDAIDERARQAAASSYGHPKTVRFQKSEKYIQAESRPLLIRSGEALACHARKMQPHAIILKSTAQQLMRAHLTDAPQLPSFTRLVQHRR
jgi:hypothetical protein